MHNLPRRSSSSEDPDDHPISFISSLHRADIGGNTTDDVNNTLSWYMDSTQLFMADDSDDPTKIQFRQTYDRSQDIQTSTGCVGHWQFYPDGDRWYDVQALGLANIVDFSEADAGYGNIKMVRVDEAPSTITEVNDICNERRERFTTSAAIDTREIDTSTLIEVDKDEGVSVAEEGEDLTAGSRRLLPIIMPTLVISSLLLCVWA